MRFIALFLFISLTSQCLSQGSFYSTIDTDTIFSDGYLKFSIIQENGPGFKLLNTDLKDFKIAQGPSQFRRSHNSNGQRFQANGLEYFLKPKKSGKLKIGKVDIDVNGQKFSSQEKQVFVIPKSKRKKSLPTYVTAETLDSTIYIGQQAVLRCNSYLNPKDKDYAPKDYYNLDLSEFYYQIQKNYAKKPVKRIVDFREQYFLNDKTISLFPKSTGEFVVGPYNTFLETRFFRRASGKLTSNAVKFEVKELPPAPNDFIGAVGNYTLSAAVNNSSVKTDESLTLTIVLRGDGDPKLIKAPKIEVPDAIEIYDASLVSENSFVEKGRIVYTLTYEYLLIPKSRGNFALRPSTVVFNPILETYDTLTTDIIQFQSFRGAKSKNQSVTQYSEREDQIIGPLENISISKQGRGIYDTFLFWIPIAVLLMAFPILWIIQYINKKKANIDPERIKYEKAKSLALDRLNKAKTHLDSNNSRAFFDAISKAIFGYASDKLKVPSAQLNSTNINAKLNSLQLSNQVQDSLNQILEACELALFAGTNQSNKMSEIYNQSLNTLEEIEHQLYLHK